MPRLIWCNEIGLFPKDGCRSTNVKAIGNNIYDHNIDALVQLSKQKQEKLLGRTPDFDEVMLGIQALRDSVNKEWLDSHIKTYCKIIARRNKGLLNLAAILEYQLKLEGHSITVKKGRENNGLSESIGTIKDGLNEAYIRAFTTAKKITISEAKERQKRKGSLSEEQEVEIKIATGQDRWCPPVSISTIFSAGGNLQSSLL